MSNRQLTRDLLLEYDKAIMPPRPRVAGLGNIYSWGSIILSDMDTLDVPIPHQKDVSIIYPWENTSLSIFSNQLYKVAIINGFVGTEKEFLDRFVNYVSDKQIVFEEYANFPQYGSTNKLYFDLDEKILYYWEDEYIPVNAMLIANTIIEGGEA
jgi:hypothetical protein